jgi:hypothetical protein
MLPYDLSNWKRQIRDREYVGGKNMASLHAFYLQYSCAHYF